MENSKISIGRATAVGLGAIIGSGIFVLSGTAIALAGANALLAFIIIGILAVIIAMEFSELTSLMPYKKGSGYSYAYEAFGSELGFISGILLYFSFASSVSVITLGFGSYLHSLLGIGTPILFAILEIAALTVLNLKGIKKAVDADFFFVIVKLAVLFIFIAAAVVIALTTKSFSMSYFSTQSSRSGILAIFEASMVVFFAYSGFQGITTFTSRIAGGAKGASKAIIYAVLISMAVYIMVVVAMLLLAPSSVYKASGDPLAFALQYAHAPYALSILIDIGALFATTSAALAMILTSSRILYQISKDGLAPRLFERYNKHSDVAINGVIITAVIAVLMLFSGDIYIITAISNFGLLFSYLIVGLALVHFRRISKKAGVNAKQPAFKLPAYPYLTIIASILLIAIIMSMPREALSIGVAMLIALLIVYYFIREFKEEKVIKARLFPR